MGGGGIFGLIDRNGEEINLTRMSSVAWEENEGNRREGGRKADKKLL